MKMRLQLLLLVSVLCIGMLVGCGEMPVDSSDLSMSTTTTTTALTTDTTASTAPASTATESTQTTIPQTSGTTTAGTTATTTVKPIVTTTTTTTTTATTATTTTAADPNRATVNGNTYAVGDTLCYTVMVKTTENYGTVKIGVRCIQNGLEVPDGTVQKQSQYVMQNLGIGRLGTMPEETVGQNGFTMTVNKGYQIDTATAGYAGLWWFYETKASREIDCSGGVALFTMQLKITKPGTYLIEGAEYAATPRADLTVWGVIEKE